MHLLSSCCLGSKCRDVYDIDAQQGSSGRAHSVAKDLSGSARHKCAASAGISHACAAVCACLPESSSDLWSQRIVIALSSVEAGLSCTARLVIFNTESLPWVFSPCDCAAGEPDRAALAYLVEVLPPQTDGPTTVLRRTRDAAGGHVRKPIMWPAKQSVVLEPLDILVLPLSVGQPASTPTYAVAAPTAALLLSWGLSDGAKTGLSGGDRHGGGSMPLSASDLQELRRLAQFLGYGLLGDPQHARYLARVCRHSALLLAASSLHDLVLTVLDAVQDLVQDKFALHVQPVLAAVHGATSPAVLFARRQAAAAACSQLRPCASDTQAQMTAQLAASMSVSVAPPSRFSAANQHLTGGGDLSNLSIGRAAANGCGPGQEVSRVKATKTSLAHTLLQQAARHTGRSPASGSLHFNAREGGTLGGPHSVCDVPSREDFTSGNSGLSGRLVRPLRAGGRAPLSSLVIPNASAYLLDEQQPCRDLLVVSKLTGGKAASLVMLTETAASGPAAMAGDATNDPSGTPYGNSRTVPTVSAAAAAVCGSDAPAAAVMSSSAEADAALCGPGVGPGLGLGEADGSMIGALQLSPRSGRVAPVSPAATAAGVGPGPGVVPFAVAQPSPPRCGSPFQLALYLVSWELLPAGLLRLLSDEMQALLPTIFGAFRGAVAAADSARHCCQSDWQRLRDQLLGLAGSTGGSANSLGADGLPPTLPTPLERFLHPGPGLALESPVNSPSPPQATQRSCGSSRLFRAHAAQSPSAYTAAPAAGQQPASLLPAPLASPPLSAVGPGNKLGLNGLAVSQGGGAVRKGVLALTAAREEAPVVHAMSTPGPTVAAGPASSLPQKAALHSLRLGTWVPEVALERAEGPSALELLVASMRQGLSAAREDDRELEAQAQDLAAVQLLEVLGRGGQGVVFRGTLHGLETAVKVLTDTASGGGGGGGGPGGGACTGVGAAGLEEQGPAAAAVAAGAGVGAGSPVGKEGEPAIHDSWDELGADGKAGEARIRQAKRGAMEIAVIGTLSHPSIVQVYASFSGVVVVRCQYHDPPRTEMRLCLPYDDMLAGKDPGQLNQVICFEYCDGGTLLSAARKGAFRAAFAVAANGPAFPALVPLYKSLLEVALALRYLHSRKLVHCDVKAANVLLKSSSRDPRGWTCKLSDFGCARMLTEVGPAGGPSAGTLGFRTAAPVGTLAYMAPECFVKNTLLTAAVDIYSFGVLMWELLMCRMPYAGMNAKDVPRQVLRHNLRPSFHPLAPSDYSALAVRCWATRLERRPTALELVGHLEQLLADAHAAAEKESAIALAAAAAKAIAPPVGDCQRPAATHLPESQVRPPSANPGTAAARDAPRPLEQQEQPQGPAAAADAVQQPVKRDVRRAPQPPPPAAAAAEPKGQCQACIGTWEPPEGGKVDFAAKKQSGFARGNGDESMGCRVLGANGDPEASAICLLPFTSPGTVLG